VFDQSKLEWRLEVFHMAIRLPAFLFWVIESICDSERRHCRPEISMSTSPTLAIPEPGDIFAQLTSRQRLLTARDVAKILAISEKTVYSYVSRNMIPYYKIEANVRFRALEVAEWLRHRAGVLRS
jgi:excisionase family DNA binding protein